MKRKLILGMIACLLMINAGYSQTDTLDKYNNSELRRFARNADRAGDIHSAIIYYNALHNRKNDNYSIIWKLADLMHKAGYYKESMEYYLLIWQGDPEKYPEAQFYYAKMLKMNGYYEEAIDNFMDFKRKYRGKDRYAYNKVIRNELEGCEMVFSNMANTGAVTLSLLDNTINNTYTELSPIPLNDTVMVYASRKVDPDNGNPVCKFYSAVKTDHGWSARGEFQGPFNLKDINTGNGVFSPDGKRFYFTRCKTGFSNTPVSEIYVSHKENGEWQKPVRLGKEINFRSYTSTHPAIGIESRKNREVLYFVSDRPGGKGGKDIWYSIYNKEKNEYSNPRNAGRRVNTAGNEITPYYELNSGTLYFSSDGLPGMGGFDVFKTTGEMRKWKATDNLGTPVNSGMDDMYYTLGGNGKQGFIVSNRSVSSTGKEHKRSDDIYAFTVNEDYKAEDTGYADVLSENIE